MLNIGPLEFLVLALVAVVIVGPEKLPKLAKDAAAMIKTLRDMATGARKQLQDELGPEFADLDLRNLNPRTAVQRAVFGDDVDLGRLNPRNALRDAIFRDEDLQAADPRTVVRETRESVRRTRESYKPFAGDEDDAPVSMAKAAPAAAPSAAPRPRPRPRPVTPYDSDAT